MNLSRMTQDQAVRALARLPKAELHLHLEGTVRPETLVELAARHGESVSREEAEARYRYADFRGFLEAFKWVTSLIRDPRDYELVALRMAEELAAQSVVYAEVIFAAGVMHWRGQDLEANFKALAGAAEQARAAGVDIRWMPDATRQFGPQAAMECARRAVRWREQGVVGFGMGGDELSLPAAEFRQVFDYARENGLHVTVHAGETGGPQEVFDAVQLLHAERIGHGIAALGSAELREFVRRRDVPLEICPTSNIATGALAKQLGAPARIELHPLKSFYDEGVPLTLGSDDPAMFHTTLTEEYRAAHSMGLDRVELADIAEAGFAYSFSGEEEKQRMLDAFRRQRDALGV
jgi:adenosine deaminase/aminodeoxyfutalosine deaminase